VLWLDPEHEVFGRFFAADRWPRRTAYLRGLELEAVGDPSAARAAFEEALTRPVALVPSGWEDFFSGVDIEIEAARLDTRIRLALARLALDEGSPERAAAELDEARRLVRGADRWLLAEELLAGESRIDLLRGEPDRAYRRLRKALLRRREVDAAEPWALLAIAARAVGEVEDFERAAARARKLGVEIGPLVEVSGGSATP
jgi:tetratricopeptide (TPR) repeat protein